MKIKVNPDITVKDILELKEHGMLTVNREYQRGEKWKTHQMQMFMDSMLRGYSAPAFYFHEKTKLAGGKKAEHTEIIDGQQRVNAITRFIRGEFDLLDPNAEKGFKFPILVDRECSWAEKRFDDLSLDEQKKLLNHKLIVYEIETEDDNEVRDLFIRLQGGTPLTPQDKRDAWPGGFTEFVLIAGGKEADDQAWHGWDLFRQVPSRRKRQLAAQAFMLYWNKIKNKEFCDIKSSNIDEFYHEHIGFNPQSQEASDFKKICDIVSREFEGYPPLVGHHLIHLVLLVADLKEYFVPSSWRGQLAEALGNFKSRCKDAAAANNEGNTDHEYIRYYFEYSQWASHRSDQAENIRRRHVWFYQEMTALLGAQRKDDERNFNLADKEYIFYRDRRLCQYCEMEREQRQDAVAKPSHQVRWEDVEIHHVVPHSEGGRTVLSNGALVHEDCHPKARKQVQAFRQWWEDRHERPDIPAEGNVNGNSRSRKLPPDGTELRKS